VAAHFITLVATYNLVGREGGFAELQHGIRHLEGARKWRSANNLVGGNETIGVLLREFGDHDAFMPDRGHQIRLFLAQALCAFAFPAIAFHYY
jgi:hypothetical protein